MTGQPRTGTRFDIHAVIEVENDRRAQKSERLEVFPATSFNLRKSA